MRARRRRGRETLVAVDGFTARVAQRWHEVDPLLPAPGALAASCGERFTAGGPGGQPAAAACEHWDCPADSLELSWGAARRFLLSPQIAGPDVAGGLAGLLARWRDHLATVPTASEDDSAAVVTWPSRDVRGVITLLRHGLVPTSVIAARPAHRRATAAPGRGDGTAADEAVVRRARPGDEDTLTRLGLATVRYDAHFGGVIERPGTAAALQHEAKAGLVAAQPWIWLAEQDGEPVGMLWAERPEAATWIAPLAGPAPVSYVLLMFVDAMARGGGVGAALVARAHAEMDAAGVAVTLLHHEQTNPLSAPFWAQQGYRPLWTSWEARPARTLR
jgi:GNAT superfamily N-acetyltransferase